MAKLTAFIFFAVVGSFSYIIMVRAFGLDSFWLFGAPQ